MTVELLCEKAEKAAPAGGGGFRFGDETVVGLSGEAGAASPLRRERGRPPAPSCFSFSLISSFICSSSSFSRDWKLSGSRSSAFGGCRVRISVKKSRTLGSL